MGELILDMFAAESGRHLADVSAFLPTPGGAAANAAVQMARLGGKAGLIGKVGDEVFGHHLVGIFADEGVDISRIRYDQKARTTLNFIALPDVNHAEMLFYRHPGADMSLSPAELDPQWMQQSRAFYFGSPGIIDEPFRSSNLEAIRIVRSAGEMVIFDANYRPSLWKNEQQAVETMHEMLKVVDVLKANETELALLTGGISDFEQASRTLLKQGPTLVVATLGPQGSLFCCEQGSGYVPGFSVPTVDASGCGDSFVGCLVFQLLSTSDWRSNLDRSRLRAILRFANAAGALTATRKGVIPALPTAGQIVDFLAKS